MGVAQEVLQRHQPTSHAQPAADDAARSRDAAGPAPPPVSEVEVTPPGSSRAPEQENAAPVADLVAPAVERGLVAAGANGDGGSATEDEPTDATLDSNGSAPETRAESTLG
jgi:hypothetical protein